MAYPHAGLAHRQLGLTGNVQTVLTLALVRFTNQLWVVSPHDNTKIARDFVQKHRLMSIDQS